MKKNILLTISTLFIISCSNEHNSNENTSIDNVTIGSQIWSSKNLDITTYRDGTPIPQVTNQTEWNNLTTGAWCYYNNDPSNGTVYGKLYNWYAIQGIHDNDANTPNKTFAPSGWHVPKVSEVVTLINYLGGAELAGGKMKSTSFWENPNLGATNESFFSGLPGGFRDYTSSFLQIGYDGFWWCSPDENPFYGGLFYLSYHTNEVTLSFNDTSYDFWNTSGCSVRLIKD
jgi:uncharacterized protein (TIGR02145 family)